jgi:hypothetical protein
MLNGLFRVVLTVLISTSFQGSVLAQTSVGTWVFKSDEGTSGASATAKCNSNGTGTYQLPKRDTYPSRCYYSGSTVTIKVWAYPEDIEVTKPPIIMKFVTDGDYISGISVLQNGERYSGVRRGTQGRTKNQIAQASNKQSSGESYVSNSSTVSAGQSTTSDKVSVGRSYYYVQCSGEIPRSKASDKNTTIAGVSAQKYKTLKSGELYMSQVDTEKAERDFYQVYMNWSPQKREGSAGSNCAFYQSSGTPGKTGTWEDAKNTNSSARKGFIAGQKDMSLKFDNDEHRVHLFKVFN